MNNNIPLVTVLLPVLKRDKHLSAALESILSQTFENFEVFLIADLNLDLNDLEELDPRVKHLKVPGEFNLSKKLNLGIEILKSKYIARMDADDISHQGRFQAQVDFLEKNPGVDVLGTGIRFIGSLPNHRNYDGEIASLPVENNELLLHMLNKNPFFHPTVMLRAKKLNDFQLRYKDSYERSQDYELWSRAAGKLTFANLSEPLLDYRLHEAQSGVTGSTDSNYFSNLAKLNYCIKTIVTLNSRSLGALRIFPYRLRQFLSSWKKRRKENRLVLLSTYP
jgi:glycosyltransferase involved in cell wall biosynthesis